MPNQNNGVAVPQQTAKQKVSTVTNRVVAVVLPLAATASAFAAEDNSVVVTGLVLTGLGTAAASIFAIKSSPALMMWGYNKILGFIGR